MRPLTAGLALVLTLAGCSLEEQPSLQPAAEGATAGGELRVAILTPGSLDPANAVDDSSRLVVSTMCDPLVQLDPATGRARGGVASSYIVSDKGRTVTLTLNKKARFSDGSKVTARDVLFSLSRVAGADYGSQNATLLEDVEGFPVLHGDEPTTKKTRATRELTGVQIVSDTAFAVHLLRPDAEFVRALSLPFATPLPRLSVGAQDEAFGSRPVCSGPYRMTAPYAPGDARITLERTPGYAGVGEAFTAGGRGYPDKVVFRIFADRDAAWQAYRKGLVDLVRLPGTAAPQKGESEAPLPALDYVGLPLEKTPFNDASVRRALSSAVDRNRIAKQVLGGARLPATSLVPQTLPKGEVTNCKPSVISDAPALRGMTVPFYFNDELGNRAVVEAISADWFRAFGLRTRLVPLSWQAFLARAGQAGGFDGPFRLSWSSPVPSRGAFLEALFSSERIGQGNLERFRSGAVDTALVDRIGKQVDDGERDIAADRLEQDLCETQPLIPVTEAAARYLLRTDRWRTAAGSLTDRSSGLPVLRELYRGGGAS